MADEKSLWLKFKRFWFPVILYSGIIFYVSSIPNVRTPLSEIHFDKALHALAYAPFGFLLARALNKTINFSSHAKVILAVFFLAFSYGVTDEFHQSFVPGRSMGFLDMAADGIGGLAGGVIFLWIQRRNKISVFGKSE